MRVSIIGSEGRLGSALKKVVNNKHEFIYCGSPECDNEAIEKSEVSILALPIPETIEILDKYSDGKLIIETCSVKAPFKKYKGNIISIHPLFGPQSYETRRKIIVAKDISIPDYGSVLSDIFPNHEFLEMDSDEHDKIMAIAQALPYFLSLSINIPEIDIDMNSLNTLKMLVNLKRSENNDVMIDSIRYNPFAEIVISELIRNIMELKVMISDEN